MGGGAAGGWGVDGGGGSGEVQVYEIAVSSKKSPVRVVVGNGGKGGSFVEELRIPQNGSSTFFGDYFAEGGISLPYSGGKGGSGGGAGGISFQGGDGGTAGSDGMATYLWNGGIGVSAEAFKKLNHFKDNIFTAGSGGKASDRHYIDNKWYAGGGGGGVVMNGDPRVKGGDGACPRRAETGGIGYGGAGAGGGNGEGGYCAGGNGADGHVYIEWD